MSFDPELAVAMQELKCVRQQAPVDSMFIHGRSGKLVVVEKLTLNEEDLHPMVTYRHVDDDTTFLSWSRRSEVFLDGRFTAYPYEEMLEDA
ncbi:MAG: hypothetical protein F6K48_20685 [Okeania sp. SIO3H1]|nr:hypothetical protein [Okeania sp. SIO3H1]